MNKQLIKKHHRGDQKCPIWVIGAGLYKLRYFLNVLGFWPLCKIWLWGGVSGPTGFTEAGELVRPEAAGRTEHGGSIKQRLIQSSEHKTALCLLQQETLHRDAKAIYLQQLTDSSCRNIITFSLTESSLVTGTGSQQLQQKWADNSSFTERQTNMKLLWFWCFSIRMKLTLSGRPSSWLYCWVFELSVRSQLTAQRAS